MMRSLFPAHRRRNHENNDFEPITELWVDERQSLFEAISTGGWHWIYPMKDFLYMRDLIIDCYRKIEVNCQSHALDEMSTGFNELDSMIGGLSWGELVIIGGHARMGKTTLALDIARHAATDTDRNGRIAILSLNKSEADIPMRLLAAEARVELNRILSGRLLSAQRWRRLASASGRLAESDIVLGCFPNMSLQELREKLISFQEKNSSLDLVIIDDLQSMNDWHVAIDHKRKLYELMEGLHSMAEDLDVALIIVSELSRAQDERPDKRPKLTDFPEYGPIELLRFDNMEADVVPFEGFPMEEFASNILLLYREEVFHPRHKGQVKTELTVAQSIADEIGTITLWFHPDFISFSGNTCIDSVIR